ncbi:trypsin-like peptidase domain-containing protein, partial [Candidatus Synechococcus spongiarum]
MSTHGLLLGLCFLLGGCASLLPRSHGPAERSLLESHQGDFVVAAVEKVGPSVVRIDTRQARSPFPLLPGGSPFDDNPPEGQGSGFITRSDGIVLTNHHVVEGAERVTVTLPSGRSYPGRVVGSDVVTDLGIVRIDGANNLPVAPLGDSDEMRPGEWAIAIGNPLGLNNSVSLGIISAIGRTTGVPEGSRVSYIQTDAAINPGNSGGPLINERAQVIGINTFIQTSPGGGISFAIPINKAREIGEQIIAYGRASHPFMGVSLRRITQELAAEINQEGANCPYPETDGVAVVNVLRDSPAEQAGLRSCDVIRSVAGVEVSTPAQVQVQVDRGRVG